MPVLSRAGSVASLAGLGVDEGYNTGYFSSPSISGKMLAFLCEDDIWQWDITRRERPPVRVTADGSCWALCFSPCARWIAYTSGLSGSNEVPPHYMMSQLWPPVSSLIHGSSPLPHGASLLPHDASLVPRVASSLHHLSPFSLLPQQGAHPSPFVGGCQRTNTPPGLDCRFGWWSLQAVDIFWGGQFGMY